jgi:anti-sigma factor RsiW
MTHAAASQRLSAYVDDEVMPAERRAVEEHLRGCATCRRDIAELRHVKMLLGALPDVEPPPGVLADLRRVPAGSGGAGAVREWLRGAFRRPAVAAAAAAAALLLIALPLAKGRVDRLQAANVGVEVYVREHAVLSGTDPFADPAYLGLLIADANAALVGQRRPPQERP